MVKSRAAVPRRAKAPERRDDAQRIAEMIDLAARAKHVADALGEKFLAYLLAMVIQEMSHVESRRGALLAAEAKTEPQPQEETT